VEIVRPPKVSASDSARHRPDYPAAGTPATEGAVQVRVPELPEAAVPAALGTTPTSNAEILLWQSRLRIDFGLLIGVLAVGAMVMDRSLRIPTILIATVVTYLAVVAGIALMARRRRRAGPVMIIATVAADILFVFGTSFVIVPPEYYDRTLLLSFAILHLTEFYFGRVVAWGSLIAISSCYLAMIVWLATQGAPLAISQEIWSLGIFIMVAATFLVCYGTFQRRLGSMSTLLERAAAGDFTGEYDSRHDARPDAITMVGRSYNRVRAQLATMVLSDPLSGCLNRRGLEQQVSRELNRARRSGGEIALIVLDIDYFKTVNDTFGHLAGDEVIRELGEVLREVARGGDVVARLGGDEFAILLPNTGASGAYRLGTRIHEAVAHRAFAGVEGRFPVTVSVGLASTLVTDENIARDLMSRADEALYAAKEAGRNRLSIWTQNLRVLTLAHAGERAAGR
jgi:diguanylate cyclase (GGDEF)-like protein